MATIAMLACTVIFVLAVPVFPTQDGPIHLYYVDILRDVLRHSGPFAQYFKIKTLLPPYAFEYYSLLALESVFSPIVSEKLLICSYIVAFGFGFRYLVNSVGERNNPWTLVGIPFCMNLLVYMGFLNYCIAVALALFLLGFWIRHWLQLHLRHMATLLVCLAFMLLTHPVPVAVFLVCIGMYFCVDLLRTGDPNSGKLISRIGERRRPLAMIAVMGGMSAAWVSLFLNHHPKQGTDTASMGWMGKLVIALKLSGIAPFRSPMYRAGLAALLVLAGLACVAGIWKHRSRVSSSAIALFASSAICFTVFCFAPFTVNDGGFFPNRFGVFGVMLLVAAAAAIHPPPRLSLVAGVVALCVTCASLPLQWVTVSRIASEIMPALDAPPTQTGSVGIIIAEPRLEGIGEPKYAPDLFFDPFLWSGAHYFRRSKAILGNSPWMDFPIIMIQPVHPDRWSYQDPTTEGSLILTALDKGDAAPELSLLVLAGPSDQRMNEIITRSHVVTISQSNGEIGIFARRP
jgi:hypothetical protein